MKISTILDHIDSGHMALPEFQRGYVWNRDQVRGLLDSLYRRHPVGSLLVWVTESRGAHHRGEQELAPGVVKLLLDGQQRMTSLYGIIRGKSPKFFDGNEQAFTGLYFHLGREEFAFYSPIKMKDDPLWIDVTRLMQEGVGPFVARMGTEADFQPHLSQYINRLAAIEGIQSVDLHVEDVAGADKTIDVVVDIFNRVNSGGTKLSQGDLALAKVCAEWPDARDTMRGALDRWRKAGFHFNLDWLLRSANTVLTGEAKFNALHGVDAQQFQDGLKRAERATDTLLNLVSGRLGLDHDRVLFGRYAFPVMAHYVDRLDGRLRDARKRDKLLYWYLHSALWGRFSGSTETMIDKDLQVLESTEGGVDRLIETLRLWRGDLRIQPGHFSGWSLGARFYPMLYLLSRVGEAQDWGSGLPLKNGLLGKLNRLQVHHIFPKALLYKAPQGYTRAQVNAVANFCFLTQDTNLEIGAEPPEAYFERVAERHPGAMESQWIPMDRELWRVERYLDFLEARKVLLAEIANTFLDELLLGERPEETFAPGVLQTVPGGVESKEEEEVILGCNEWVVAQGLPEGEILHELAHPQTGEPLAVLDLAWPDGLQAGLSQPVALLIDEGPETLATANAAGFRYFTSVEKLKTYVEQEVLALEEEGV